MTERDIEDGGVWVADFTFTIEQVNHLLDALEATKGNFELMESLRDAAEAYELYSRLEEI